ncbi:paraneoplastic antigen Ma3 homolog [Misgurnus anguillicaudatus]|uniref:paraneoplastic antigen Ma3 homolog n=1 Tax=Misgurnus anguillicaudatus TaxID=75329 RepID=UPI003CCFDC14
MSVSDVERRYHVKANCSVCVLGVTDTDTDDDIAETLKKYGVVVKIVRVAPSAVQSGQPTAIVEFDTHTPVLSLEPELPLEVNNVRNPTVTWHIDTVKVLAPLTKQSHAQAEHSSLDSSDVSSGDVDSDVTDQSASILQRRKGKSQLKRGKVKSTVPKSDSISDLVVRKKTSKPTLNVLTTDELNPPEVQRIVVEHVIKNDTSAVQTHSKWLRSFSGRVPKPPGEADFDTWCLHVDLLLQDSLPPDVQRRKILESLLPPASDVVKQLGSTAPPKDYVKLLDSAYGLVEDGDEIFARFLNTHQDAGEKASDYLQRLQTILSTAVRRSGVKESSANRHLLKQFQRGCWDHSLILTLQLESKARTPPDFAELLLLLRTEEDRRAAKLDRMQRHIGSSKHKAASHVQLATNVSAYGDSGLLQACLSETEALRRQVADLKLQLESSKSKKNERHEPELVKSPKQMPAKVETNVQHVTSKPPKPWFCFRCGEDGHVARLCEGSINKALVDRKYKELKAKQDDWTKRTGMPLNQSGFQ